MINRAYLGDTGIEVTELCFGLLTCGPLQRNLNEEDCIALIRNAMEKGINFFDTAESYRTQEYLGKAIHSVEGRVIISTKSGSRTYQRMKESVEKSLNELQVDTIDIYHLHAAKADGSVFDKREEALACLNEYKEKGIIKAVGISTHNVKVVQVAAKRDDIDVIFPIINKTGLGLLGGTVSEMITAIEGAAVEGKGILAMKALGGGNLIDDIPGALDFVRSINGIHSIAIGVASSDELDYNYAYFSGDAIPTHLLNIEKWRKELHITPYCIGCGACVRTCPNNALSLVDGKAIVNRGLCILCGYCSSGCPQFAIRIV